VGAVATEPGAAAAPLDSCSGDGPVESIKITVFSNTTVPPNVLNEYCTGTGLVKNCLTLKYRSCTDPESTVSTTYFQSTSTGKQIPVPNHLKHRIKRP
jgi:hypothetical protein